MQLKAIIMCDRKNIYMQPNITIICDWKVNTCDLKENLKNVIVIKNEIKTQKNKNQIFRHDYKLNNAHD
jgi:hypothetical protein